MNAMRGLAYGEATAFSPAGSLLVLLAGAVLGVALGRVAVPVGPPGRGAARVAGVGVLVLVPYALGALLL
jgi:hypothetical protein